MDMPSWCSFRKSQLPYGNISFERADEFNPEDTIYVYECDSSVFTSDKLECVDDDQYALDQDEVVPTRVIEYKAGDVFNYYSLVDFVPPHLREV